MKRVLFALVAGLAFTSSVSADDYSDLRRLFRGHYAVLDCAKVEGTKLTHFQAGGKVVAIRDRMSVYVQNERDAGVEPLSQVLLCNIHGMRDLGKDKPADWPLAVAPRQASGELPTVSDTAESHATE